MNEDHPQCIDTGKGFTILYRGRHLYSPSNPRLAAEKRARRIKAAENTLFFVPSLGLGYGLAVLLRLIPDSCHVLCVEADQALMATGLNDGEIPRSSQLTVVRTDEILKVRAILRRLGTGNYRRITIVRLCAGYQLYSELYDEMRQALDEEIRNYWSNRITTVHMGRLWIRNAVANLAFLPRSGDLSELSAKKPIVVSGAGPSLEGHLPVLRKLRSRFHLLATDTSLPVLGQAGITPDLIFALEAQSANMNDFLSHSFPQIPLLCDISSSPNVIRLPRSKLFFFASKFTPLRLFDRLAEAGLLPTSIPPMGSVGVAALKVALELTQAPVVLVGLDFSYVGGRTHARSTPAHTWLMEKARRVHPPEHGNLAMILRRPLMKGLTQAGKPILTDMVLESYADQARQLIGSENRVYTLGSEGIPNGAKVLEDVLGFEVLLGPEQGSGESRMEIAVAATPPGIEDIRSMAERELARLDNLMDWTSKKLLSGHTRTESLSKTEIESLEEMDYLYFFFPDTIDLPDVSYGYLSRIHESARSFRMHWQRLTLL